MAKIDPRWTEGSAYNIIQELAIGFQKSQILFTAVKLDIFTVIGDIPKTVVELSNLLQANTKFLERLLDALVSIKLLDKQCNSYSNTELSAKHLIKTSKDYYGYLSHNSNLWESWGTLYDVIKKGKIQSDVPINDKPELWIANYLESCDYRSKLQMEDVLKLFPEMVNFEKMLTLGIGSMRYTIEIAKLYPNIDIYRFDAPNVINILEKKLKTEYDGNKIYFLKGDITKDDLGSNYNCIYIETILQNYSVLENIQILKKIYNSLAKGGKLIMHQPIIDDTRTTPLITVLDSISLMVNTPSGNTYTHSDIWVTVKEAGFSTVEFYKTQFATQVIIASKSIIG